MSQQNAHERLSALIGTLSRDCQRLTFPDATTAHFWTQIRPIAEAGIETLRQAASRLQVSASQEAQYTDVLDFAADAYAWISGQGTLQAEALCETPALLLEDLDRAGLLRKEIPGDHMTSESASLSQVHP